MSVKSVQWFGSQLRLLLLASLQSGLYAAHLASVKDIAILVKWLLHVFSIHAVFAELFVHVDNQLLQL